MSRQLLECCDPSGTVRPYAGSSFTPNALIKNLARSSQMVSIYEAQLNAHYLHFFTRSNATDILVRILYNPEVRDKPPSFLLQMSKMLVLIP